MEITFQLYTTHAQNQESIFFPVFFVYYQTKRKQRIQEHLGK